MNSVKVCDGHVIKIAPQTRKVKKYNIAKAFMKSRTDAVQKTLSLVKEFYDFFRKGKFTYH